MKTHKSWAPGAKVNVYSVKRGIDRWVVEAETQGQPFCPGCRTLSGSRHSSYLRCLQDLPVQGIPVMIKLRSRRWRCRNPACARKIFTERLPGIASPLARRSCRVMELVRLIGHSAGGRPGERLMERFAMPASDDTILRQLKRAAKERPPTPSLRAIGIDDWAWRKDQTYGTIMVDLEQRTVVDLLPDRSAITAASWLAEHPTIEIVSRDRCGLYATAAVSGAPHARQAADRFHLIQNLREAIEKQLGGIWRPIRIAGHPAAPAGENDNLPREALEQRSQAVQARSAIFMQVRTLYEAGNTAAEIVRELGLSRKRVDKWICLQTLPTRNPMAPKPCTPAFYKAYLESRWAEGYQNGRGLFNEIKHLGYTGCFFILGPVPLPLAR